MRRFPTTPQSGTADIGGRIYSTHSFETSLFAIAAGEITVGPCTIPAMYYESQQYARVPSIFRRANRSTFTSNSFKLKVKPLPEQGKPADFTGAVGTFELTQNASPTTLEVGDPISIDLHVSGVGNFDSLEAPVMTNTEGWQLYPARELVQNLSDGITDGKITYSQVAIPLQQHREIPPFRLSYFDPKREKYFLASSDPVPIDVAPDATTTALEASAERPGMSANSSQAATGKPICRVRRHPSPSFQSHPSFAPSLRPFSAHQSSGCQCPSRARPHRPHRNERPPPLARLANREERKRHPAHACGNSRDHAQSKHHTTQLLPRDPHLHRHRRRPRQPRTRRPLETAALDLLYASKLANATAPITPTESKVVLDILEQQ